MIISLRVVKDLEQLLEVRAHLLISELQVTHLLAIEEGTEPSGVEIGAILRVLLTFIRLWRLFAGQPDLDLDDVIKVII